jgi:hypothetical protein
VLAGCQRSGYRCSIQRVRLLATAYIGFNVVGAVRSLRRGRPARFLGVQLPGPPVAKALTIGTPLSAPPAMLIALAVAAHSRRDDIVLVLSAMFIVGIVGEPDTYRALRRPVVDPISSTCAALDAALPAAMAASALRARRRR